MAIQRFPFRCRPRTCLEARIGARSCWLGDPFWRVQTLAVLFAAGLIGLIVWELRQVSDRGMRRSRDQRDRKLTLAPLVRYRLQDDPGSTRLLLYVDQWEELYTQATSREMASFEEWVEKCLVPTLSKGDIVVMDNLSSHKGPRVEQLIKAAGAELRYLPPYSPDMNPIEKAYSKLKAFLRRIAERTVAGLLIALDACADIFKPAECVNYFEACGYDTG